jgi:hypothetical protein
MSAEFYRSLGLELSGPKNDRSALAVLDYHPKTQKLILVDIETPLSGINDLSSDETLYTALQLMTLESKNLTGLSVHGPLSLPPGFETKSHLPKKGPPHFSAQNAQIEWMFQTWKKLHPQPKPFVPYIQRPAEIYLRHLTPEKFQIPDALGANFAPITARLQFLKPYLPTPLNEVFPKATMSRLVTSLGLSRAIYRDYLDIERGLETREIFFENLAKKLPQIFFYEKDIDTCVTNIAAFNAFLSALTQHLWFKEQTEKAPKSFPKNATWIHLPKRSVRWNDVF